jgi:RNA polymerase sigma-70 factor (ECF subfamily)
MSQPDWSDDRLLDAYRAGNDDAATQLFHRYYQRLTGLARRHLGWELQGVEDSADLALSVFETVFRRCRSEQVVIQPDQSLWPLLAAITLNKARNRQKFHHRMRRDRSRQTSLADRDPLQSGPAPDDAVILKELVEQLVQSFESKRRQQILRLLLEGQPISEIASQLDISERTVYKTREAAMQVLSGVLQSE